MRNPRIWASLLTLLFIASPQPGWGKKVKYNLDNGMGVVIDENHSSHVVAVQVWVKAGGSTEPSHLSGISHVLEHMAFKGTKKRGVGEIAKEVEALGGNINAYTSFDHTVYHITISSDYVEKALEILSDTLANSQFDKDELKKEVEVVLEEYRMNQDNPSRVSRKTLFKDYYGSHPYGRPILGTPETLKSLTREKVVAYFRDYYVPENMVLVITGDINAENIKPLIDKHMGGLKGKKLPFRALPPEPGHSLSFSITRMPTKRAHINIAFPGVSIRSKEVFGFDLLGYILGRGETSRLYSRVKDELGLVDHIYAYSFTPKGPGMLLIGATCDPNKVEKALSSIFEEIYRIASQGVSGDEFERAKKNTLADFIYQLESQDSLARTLGYFETALSDAFFEERYAEMIGHVTKYEIQKMAKTYLKPSNFAVTVVVPKETKLDLDENNVASLASRTYENAFKKKQKAKKMISEKTLKNRIRLIVRENHAVPVVAVNIGFLGGVRAETKETNGACSLMASLLKKGTARKSAEELSETIEGMAASVEPFSGRNSFGLKGEFLSEDFEKGMKIMSEMILAPSFEEDEIEKSKKEVIAAIKAKEDKPIKEVIQIYLESQYGNHPYSLDPLGKVETVESISRQTIVDFYNRLVAPGNMVIVVSGDVGSDRVKEVISTYFGDFAREGDSTISRKIEVPPLKKPITSKLKREKLQSHFIIGFLGTTFRAEDRYPLDVLAAALAGQGGRLFSELRDKQSFAYSLSAFSSEQYDRGFLAFYMGTAANKLEDGIQAMWDEIIRCLKEKLTKEELKRAKNFLVGNYEIDLQSNSAYAETLMFNVLYGTGTEGLENYVEKIKKVTVSQVLETARKYIDMDRYVLAVISP